jgi:hypothetical protein
MTWVAVGVAGVSLVAGVYSSSQAASNSAKQASSVSNAENDAIAKQNMSQQIRNAYRTGMMNMQLGLQKKRAVQEGFDTTVKYTEGRGALDANMVAAGAVGASADAVVNDIDMQFGQAKEQQQENFQSTLDQYNNELDAMRMNALNNVVEARKYEYNGPSSGQMIGSALLNAAVSAAGTYATRQMSLGLGPKPTANVSSTTGVMAGFRTDPFGPSVNRFNFGG